VRGRQGSGVMNDVVSGEESGSSVVGSARGVGESRESLCRKPEHCVLPLLSEFCFCCRKLGVVKLKLGRGLESLVSWLFQLRGKRKSQNRSFNVGFFIFISV